MLDFGILPPEITSARMYAGPGAGPMMAAAAAWDALAAEMESAAQIYGSVIAGLQGQDWSGDAYAAMSGAAAPYVTWMTTTATQAEQAASQARAAAAAFQTAYAATVPPVVVTANRAQLLTLVATNIFGQNTTLIAANEADYARMWAQDTAAMYGYAGAASSATALKPFSEPPATTNAAGESAQSAAVAQAAGTSTATQAQTTLSQAMSSVPQHLQALAAAGSTGSSTEPVLDGVSAFNTLSGPTSLASNFFRTATSAMSGFSGVQRSLLQTATDAAKAAAPAVGVSATAAAAQNTVRGAVLASVANAAPVGQLSVPQAWSAAAPAASSLDTPLWLSETELAAAQSWEAAPATSMVGGAPMGAMPMASLTGRPSVNNILRVGPRRFSMPRFALGG